jgi:hypothetical protein
MLRNLMTAILPLNGHPVADAAVNPDRLADYVKDNPWGGAQVAADCYSGKRFLRFPAEAVGGGYGFVHGATSATELGLRGMVGVGVVSGGAVAAAAGAGASILGCAGGIAAGQL